MIRSAGNLRVLMVVDQYPPTICGIGDYAANLCRAMVAKDVDVEVLCRAEPGLPSTEEVDGVAVHRLAENWTRRGIKPLMQYVEDAGPGTIVHLQYPSLRGYERRLTINWMPALFRTCMRRWPLVVTMHGFHEHRLRWRLRVLPMLWAHSAMIYVHPRDRELAARFAPFSSRRSELIPIAANVPALAPDSERRNRVRAELGISPDERVAVFFGEVRPDKGLHSLFDAVERLHNSGLPARVLTISTIGLQPHGLYDYEREIMTRIEKGSREGWATLARAKTPERASEILQAADVATFPFTLGAAENRGSLMAAVVNQVPVLTTRGISTPPDYEEVYGVETVAAGDDAAFGARLETLLRSVDERAALAAKAKAAADRFSWDGIAEKNIEVYRKCLAK